MVQLDNGDPGQDSDSQKVGISFGGRPIPHDGLGFVLNVQRLPGPMSGGLNVLCAIRVYILG